MFFKDKISKVFFKNDLLSIIAISRNSNIPQKKSNGQVDKLFD